MSIATEILRLQTAKANQKAYLQNKGVDMSDNPLIDAYLDRFKEIGTKVEKDVNFYAIDDNFKHYLAYSYTLAEVQALTALPDVPTKSGSISQGWNYTLAQVQALTYPCDIGAIYKTNDNRTRFYFTFINVAQSNGVVINIYKQTTDLMTIHWGDGSTSTSSASGSVQFTHSYGVTGDFQCDVECLGDYYFNTYVFGQSSLRNGFLINAEMSNSVTSIGTSDFQYCYSLQSITIPSSVTSIGTSAFNNCISLQSITIPSSVTSIGISAFFCCYSLQSITIPSSVTSIGTSAFYNCYSLQSITIPSSVTSIGTYAFQYCISLQSITIPSSVTSIGTSAFYNCLGIIEYHLKGATPPTIDSTTFIGIRSDCKIYVPAAALTTYQNATNWNSLTAYLVGE